MFGQKSNLDTNAIEKSLKKSCENIIVPEFSQSVTSLGWFKSVKQVNKNVQIDMQLPTFALKSEKEIAVAVKKRAMDLLGADWKIELNVYAKVKPGVEQSIANDKIANVKNIILVASGKGGVGKSTVASNLVAALHKLGSKVGLLDADIYGPSIPTMFGVKKEYTVEAVEVEGEKNPFMLPAEKHGIPLMSIGFLVDVTEAMAWRGPMIASACLQMFSQVFWGNLDYLVVDLPPGTGDIQLSIAQKVNVAGAVIVSTPQDVALADVIRAKSMFDKVQIPILGIVENMSYFVCDGCEKRHEIFTHGGAKKSAKKLEVPFLSEIPLEPSVMQASEEGTPIALANKNSKSKTSFIELAQTVATSLVKTAMKNKEESLEIQVTGKTKSSKKTLPVLS